MGPYVIPYSSGPEFCEKGLSKAAEILGEEGEGYTRSAVFAFLRAESERIGVQIGWKALQEGKVVASQKADPKAPFVGFSQWAGHMYAYCKDTPALNNMPVFFAQNAENRDSSVYASAAGNSSRDADPFPPNAQHRPRPLGAEVHAKSSNTGKRTRNGNVGRQYSRGPLLGR